MCWLAVVAAGVAIYAIPASAMANPAYEPNNGIHQAFGPLQANTDYDATISSDNERDWYIVYVSGQGVLDIAFTNLNQNTCCSDPDLDLYDENGTSLNGTSAAEGVTEHLTYTTPGAGHYYLRVAGGIVPDTYRLRLTGPITDGPRPGPPDEITPNASRDAASAYGPLVGDRLYGGSIDANGEEDWFFFNTAGAGQFDVKFTNINDNNCCSDPSVTLFDHEGVETFTSLNSTSVSRDTIGHLRFTAAGPEQFFLRVEGGIPVDNYQFVITPGSLLTPNTPAHATEACQKAEDKLAKAKEKLANAKATFAPKKKLRKLKDKVKKAKKKVKKVC